MPVVAAVCHTNDEVFQVVDNSGTMKSGFVFFCAFVGPFTEIPIKTACSFAHRHAGVLEQIFRHVLTAEAVFGDFVSMLWATTQMAVLCDWCRNHISRCDAELRLSPDCRDRFLARLAETWPSALAVAYPGADTHIAAMNSLGIEKAPQDTRVVVAMSGGVDSSVTAALMVEAGYDVVGITLQLYDHGEAIHRKNACCAGQDIHDARNVASRLDIRITCWITKVVSAKA